MAKITLNIDSTKKKINEIKGEITVNDEVDYSILTDEEFQNEGIRLATNEKKLHDLLVQVKSLYEINHKEFEKHKDASQLKLIDIDTIKYEDTDGSGITVGFTKEIKTYINRAQLDKETGVQVSVTGKNLDLYTVPCVRGKRKKIIDAVQNGIISTGCITTTTIEKGHFIFDEPTKKGGN